MMPMPNETSQPHEISTVSRLAASTKVVGLQRVLVAAYSFGLLWVYGSEVNPDFAVFHGGAIGLLAGSDLYGSFVGGMPYVNGPGLAVLLLPLTPFTANVAMGLWVGL